MATCADCNLYNGTDEEQRSLIMEVYYPFIIETVRSTDILVHLAELQDHCSELRMLDKEGKHTESMVLLLRYLDASDRPRKWKPFIAALNSAGYEDLYRGLEYGEDIPVSEYEINYKRIWRFLPSLIERVRLDSSGILPVLFQNKIISEHQLESIRACSRYNSNQDAILELIVHLHTKTQKWYTVFLEALLQDGQNDLVENIDPEFMLAKKRKKMRFNFDSLDYEENRLSDDGEAVDSVLLNSSPQEDRAEGVLPDSDSHNTSQPSQTNIRDYEVEFPPFPKCPRVITNEDMSRFLDVIDCWKADKLKPWCKNMEKIIKRNTDLIRSRDDLFYLVDKWLVYLQTCVELEYGEIDGYKVQIEMFSRLVLEYGVRHATVCLAIKEANDMKVLLEYGNSMMIQQVKARILLIKHGQVDNIEDPDDNLTVCGINCGKVVKRIGRMWKKLN